MDDEVLRCRDLRKTFGELVAVDGVGFTIAEGETYGLLGPNGAGKTTTISMIAGILERDDGEVLVDGRPLGATSVQAKAGIGYVPQELAVYPDLTGLENLRFFARLYGISRAEVRKRAAEVLEIIGLTDRAGDQVKAYSGGMKRRLNIGIGLLHRPRLLILDEPTAGVDPQSRNAILENVERLAGEGLAVLYTTHYMEEAERLCDRVGIIDLGKLRAEGTRRELIGLVGERDRVTLTAEGNLVQAARAASALDGVRQADTVDSRIDLVVDDAKDALPRIFDAVVGTGAAVRSVEVSEPDLESVFLHLTGKALRD
ncbi:MAG TPA: ABC transporter ATP-binding protein [Streptosporangiaceae bacterium]|jgi:ABC-2 type transport system ATP-binding protein